MSEHGCNCGSPDRWLMSPNHGDDCPMLIRRREPVALTAGEQTAGEAIAKTRSGTGYAPRLMNVFIVELNERGDYRERALTGWPLDLVILPRWPHTEREEQWVENQLLCRLVPGGRVVTL